MKALDFLAGNISLLSSLEEVKIEAEKTKVQKMQAEIERIRNAEDIEEYEDDGFLEAMTGEVGEIWDDFEED